MKTTLVDYLDILFEQFTLELELECLSDDVLLDECNHILSGSHSCDDVDDILTSYFKHGCINQEERKRLEGLYKLAYGDFILEV